MKEFLEVFGGIRVASVVVLIAALVFLYKIYKIVAAHFEEKYRLESEKEEQMQAVLNQVKMYPTWRAQSIERQKEFTAAISDLQKTQQEITKELKNIEERRKNTERNKLEDRLLQSYRYFTSLEKNPMQAWSEMESKAFWKMFKDYEDVGGDGHMHSEVQPKMCLLEVVPMHETDRVTDVMQSRR